jgi:hypothetical protein
MENNKSLPEIDVKPDLGRALSAGWEIMMTDIVGSLLVTLVFFIFGFIAALIPIIGWIGFRVLEVGLFGWADERRRGLLSGIDNMMHIARDRFNDAVVLAVIMFALGLALALPALICYIPIYMSLFGYLMSGSPVTGNPQSLPPFFNVVFPMMGLMYLWVSIMSFVVMPFIASFEYMAYWAIVRGHTWRDSIRWAWARIKKAPFDWWLAGLVITLLCGAGAFFCYIGILFSYPWGVIAFTVLVSDEEGRDLLDRMDPAI